MHSKNTEAPFPIYYYIYYCPKWYTYSSNINSFLYDYFRLLYIMFQQYCTRMNKEKQQVTILDNYAKSVFVYNRIALSIRSF
mgnify:CR=1 FL=1